jgi:glyoxylase-like metal-dependent hydrolase (beta-lactamase superfamily II)
MVERVIVGPWKTNCYIYSSTKKECIIIDPGGDEVEIAARVDVLNMVPVGIALTHGHVDHVAALGRLREGYASRGYKLPIAINPGDRRFLGSGGLETHRESLEHLGLDEVSFFGEDSSALPKADVRLKDGDRVFNMELVVLETPGHTPGSVCFYAEKEGILFSGDTLFFDGVGRTDMPGGSEKKLRESIQGKIAVLPPETRVFSGHGPFTTVERERRGNPFFRIAPQEVRQAPRKQAPVAPAAALVRPAPKQAKPRNAARKSLRPIARKKPAPARSAHASSRAASRPVNKAVRPAKKIARAEPLKRKSGVVTKKHPGAAVPAKKRVQAAKSTKAPRSSRKPAR